jgi:serine/threonine protein kinase
MPDVPELDRTAITPGDCLPGYEMLSVVGAGGFGTVYKARQFKLDRTVAVKVVRLDPATQPALAARIQNEAVTLGRLHHPNIVQVYDYGLHDGRMYIVMELLEGEDLGARLKRGGKLEEPVAWAIARQTASALAHAAGHGVIHRDIKPPNLVLVEPPTGHGLRPGVPLVKVTDFGLARTKWAADGDDGRITAPGMVLGTPMYMAPEQYRGTGEQDHRADVYSLGATTYHALAGKPPFAGDNVWTVMAQKMEHSPPSWPAVSRESIELLQAMMAPDPVDRIRSYEEVIERIDLLLGRSDTATRVERGERFDHSPRSARVAASRRWLRRAAVVAGSFAVAAFGVHIGLPSASSTATVNRASLPNYVSDGHEALFDNASLKGWAAFGPGSAWQIGVDDDRARILTGRGFVRRQFEAPDNYRITLGLDLHDSDAVEIHFGLAPENGRRLVLRVTRQVGALLGAKDRDAGEFRPLGSAVPFPPEKWFKDRSPYPEVRFERVAGWWRAWFNGTEVGRAAVEDSPKSGDLRLNAVGGLVRVDSVILEPLKLIR